MLVNHNLYQLQNQYYNMPQSQNPNNILMHSILKSTHDLYQNTFNDININKKLEFILNNFAYNDNLSFNDINNIYKDYIDILKLIYSYYNSCLKLHNNTLDNFAYNLYCQTQLEYIKYTLGHIQDFNIENIINQYKQQFEQIFQSLSPDQQNKLLSPVNYVEYMKDIIQTNSRKDDLYNTVYQIIHNISEINNILAKLIIHHNCQPVYIICGQNLLIQNNHTKQLIENDFSNINLYYDMIFHNKYELLCKFTYQYLLETISESNFTHLYKDLINQYQNYLFINNSEEYKKSKVFTDNKDLNIIYNTYDSIFTFINSINSTKQIIISEFTKYNIKTHNNPFDNITLDTKQIIGECKKYNIKHNNNPFDINLELSVLSSCSSVNSSQINEHKLEKLLHESNIQHNQGFIETSITNNYITDDQRTNPQSRNIIHNSSQIINHIDNDGPFIPDMHKFKICSSNQSLTYCRNSDLNDLYIGLKELRNQKATINKSQESSLNQSNIQPPRLINMQLPESSFVQLNTQPPRLQNIQQPQESSLNQSNMQPPRLQNIQPQESSSAQSNMQPPRLQNIQPQESSSAQSNMPSTRLQNIQPQESSFVQSNMQLPRLINMQQPQESSLNQSNMQLPRLINMQQQQESSFTQLNTQPPRLINMQQPQESSCVPSNVLSELEQQRSNNNVFHVDRSNSDAVNNTLSNTNNDSSITFKQKLVICVTIIAVSAGIISLPMYYVVKNNDSQMQNKEATLHDKNVTSNNSNISNNQSIIQI